MRSMATSRRATDMVGVGAGSISWGTWRRGGSVGVGRAWMTLSRSASSRIALRRSPPDIDGQQRLSGYPGSRSRTSHSLPMSAP